MAKTDNISIPKCRIVEALKGESYKVRLPNGHELIASRSGKMRKFRISLVPGDLVTVAIAPDLTCGLITYREREHTLQTKQGQR